MGKLPGPTRCPHAACPSTRSATPTAFVRQSFPRTGAGRKQRWRCKSCGRTFTRRAGTLYHRLRLPASKLDLALTLSLDPIELLRCCYSFVRRHGALKLGREVRTPAQQAGLVTRRLSLRDILMACRPGS